MALATYANLQTAIQDWMFDRTDLTMATTADFVVLCEGELNNGAPAIGNMPPVSPLRTRDQLTTTELTPSSGVCDLPADYAQYRQVTALTDPRRVLEAVAPSFRDTDQAFRSSGLPSWFSISGDEMLVLPTNAANVELEYYAKVPALSGAANWLLTKFPNVYLYGCLKHACIYIGDERAQTMAAMFSGLVDGLNASDVKSMYARAAARVSRVTP